MKPEELISAFDDMKVPENAKENVIIKIHSHKERKNKTMSFKKFIIAAAAAVMLIGAGVYAAGGTMWMSSSSSKADYSALPSEKTCIKDCGYAPVLTDEFSNGYSFSDGNIVKNEITNEDGSGSEKFKSFSFKYKKGKDTVYFDQMKDSGQTEVYGDIAATENGTDIYFFSYENKFVPADYKLSDAEKAAEAAGEIVFSYGSDKVEQKTITIANWKNGGIYSSLMQMNGKLSKDELTDMAKEAIIK